MTGNVVYITWAGNSSTSKVACEGAERLKAKSVKRGSYCPKLKGGKFCGKDETAAQRLGTVENGYQPSFFLQVLIDEAVFDIKTAFCEKLQALPSLQGILNQHPSRKYRERT